MIRRLLPLVLLAAFAGSLSAITIGPELPLDYNALQSAQPQVQLNIGRKMIRIDQEAQISPLYTTLMPASLAFDSLQLEEDAINGLNGPKAQLMHAEEANASNTITDLLSGLDSGASVVEVIGLAMTSSEILADVARLVDPLEMNNPANQNTRFPAASLLSQALSQRS